MSIGSEAGRLHAEVTQRSGYRYFFYDKHHGRGGPEVARWALDLNDDDEFAIFNNSDRLQLDDEKGNLYGIRIGPEPDAEVLYLGTLRQQIARFPVAHQGVPWHGYPLGPLEHRPSGARPPQRDLPDQALRRMVEVGLLNNPQRKRLLKGRNI